MKALPQSQLLLASNLLITLVSLSVLWRCNSQDSHQLLAEIVDECMARPALRESAPCLEDGFEPMNVETKPPRDETPLTDDAPITLDDGQKPTESWEPPLLSARMQSLMVSDSFRHHIANQIALGPSPLDMALARPCPFDLPVGEFRKIPFHPRSEKALRRRHVQEVKESMDPIAYAPKGNSSIITLDEKDDTLGYKMWQQLHLPDPRLPYRMEIEAGFVGHAQVMAYTHAEDLASYHLVAEGALAEGSLLSLPLRTPTSRHRLVLVVSCRPEEDGPFQARMFQQPWPSTPILYKSKGRSTKE